MFVLDTGLYAATIISIDPLFKVFSVFLAQQSLKKVIDTLKGKTVFGSNFPIIERRSPSVRVYDDRVLIFDHPEP